MTEEVASTRVAEAKAALEPRVLSSAGYRPLLPPTAVSVGRGMIRRLIESVVETIPVAGAGLVELYRYTHPTLADRIRQRWEQRITRTVNRLGSTLEAHSVALMDLQSFVISKANYDRAGEAGQLSFFNTGMLGKLRELAAGKGDATTMEELAGGLRESEKEVEVIVASLTAARNMMQSQPENIAFSHRLDEVLYSPIGKIGIRESIERIINKGISNPRVREDSSELCNNIEQFNAKIADLAFERRS